MTLLPDHPNVLRLLGACMQPPLMTLVTPFCPKSAPALAGPFFTLRGHAAATHPVHLDKFSPLLVGA